MEHKSQKKITTQTYELKNTAHRIAIGIRAYQYVLEEMESFIIKSPNTPRQQFSLIAQDVIERNETIRSIQLAKANVISQVYPTTGNEQALGHKLLEDARHQQDIKSVMQKNGIKMSGPFDLLQGGQGLIIRKAISILDPESNQEKYWGLAIVVLDWQKLQQKLDVSSQQITAIRAHQNDQWQPAFYGDNSAFMTGLVSEVNVLNSRWQIALSVKEHDVQRLQNILLLCFVGFLLITLVGYKSRHNYQWIFPVLGGLFIFLIGATIISISYQTIKQNNYQKLLLQTQMFHNKIQQHLNTNLEYMRLLSASRQQGTLTKASFQRKVSLYVKEHSELINITWINASFFIEDAAPIKGNEQIIGLKVDLKEPKRAAHLAKETHYPIYTKAFQALQGKASFEVWLPVYQGEKFLGLFTGVYSIKHLLAEVIETGDKQTYGISLISDEQGIIDQHLVDNTKKVEFVRQLPLSPPGYGMKLEVTKYKTQLWSVETIILSCIAFMSALGLIIGLLFLLRTRSQLKAKNLELNTSHDALFFEKELSLITLNSIGEGVITLGLNGKINSINPVAEKILQLNQSKILDIDLVEVLPLVDTLNEASLKELITSSIQKVMESKTPVTLKGVLNRGVLKNDETNSANLEIAKSYNLHCTFAAILDKQQLVVGIVIVLHDISDIYSMTQELEYEATHDSLTGLKNRREFDRQLQSSVVDAQQHDSYHALLYIDLDQFKIVNDTCGHIAGDELLKQLSRLIESKIDKENLISRLGGDEFAIVLYDCPIEKAMGLAEEIRFSVEQFRFIWEQKNFSLGVSIGAVTIDRTVQSHQQLLSRADVACYIAKDKGRNQIHLYVEDDNESHRRHTEMHWVAQINHALENDLFALYQQRLHRFSDTTEKEHYEILLRLLDTQGQVVNPGAFLPAAERYGMMLSIDRWVINHTVKFFVDNPQKLEQLAVCSVNLSAQSLVNKEFLGFIERLLSDKPDLCHKLCFEITETAVVSNLTQANHFIQKLKSLGCKMALDDFGSGMASFGYLKDLDVDVLKIDGSFVRNCAEDPIDLAIVESIHGIAQVMKMQTVAEWVEHQGTIDVLQEIGVDYVQGYAIAKPVPLS